MASEFQLPPAGMLPQEQDQEGGLRLDRFASALKRHVLLIAGVTTVTASAAVFKAVTDTPTYQAGFELLTPPVTLETQIISTLNPDALSNQSDIVGVAVDETKLKILTSPRVMEPILEELQKDYPDITYGNLVSNLRITPDQTGNTLTVYYKGTNPEQVISVLEVVSEAYLRYSLEDRQSDIHRGIDFVDEQLPIARRRVEELEGELEALRQQANLIDPLLQGEQLSEQTAKFVAEQLDLRVQIEQTQELYQSLQQELSNGGELAASSALLQNDRYQALLNQLLEVDSQLAQELTLYLEDSPEIEVLEERRRNLQPLLQREGIRVQEQVASQIRELQDRDQALSDTIRTLNQSTKQLSTVAREYNNIQRELEIATTNLNQLLTKREALRIDAAQRQTPWEVLTPPSDPKASSASAKRNLVLGTVLGLLLGSGIAILVDRRSGKVHTVDELKETARLPLLAAIPYNKLLLHDDQSLTFSMNHLGTIGLDLDLLSLASHVHDDQQEHTLSPFFEAFRMLATNIRLSNPDHPIKSFAISSAIPNAGKSTISFYLAYAAASMGQRVLLVDADLRRPTLHRMCNIPNMKGISNYTTGEYELEDVIVDLPMHENLFLLPSGPVPPDPIKILSAQKIDNLLQRIYEWFDLVIFDTPPLLGFADSYVVTARTQGVLLAFKLGQIKRSQVETVLDELRLANVPILGMVANGGKEDKDHSYSYYQYYQQPAEESYELLDNKHYIPEMEEQDSINGSVFHPLTKNLSGFIKHFNKKQ